MTKQDRIYPCEDCGVLRSEEEGGKIFTVCDSCWDKAYKTVSTEEVIKEKIVEKINELERLVTQKTAHLYAGDYKKRETTDSLSKEIEKVKQQLLNMLL